MEQPHILASDGIGSGLFQRPMSHTRAFWRATKNERLVRVSAFAKGSWAFVSIGITLETAEELHYELGKAIAKGRRSNADKERRARKAAK